MSLRWANYYEKAPVWLQNLALTAFSAKLHRERYGPEFERFCALLAQMERAAPQTVQQYQDTQLQRLVTHAYATVPYYRDLFDARGLKPIDIRQCADLAKLPLLTRTDVRRHFDALRSRAFDVRALRLGHTSGTTGSPLEVYYDAGVIHMTYALMDRQYRWAGARLARGGDRIAVLRGNVVVPVGQRKPPFWRYNRYHRQLLLSSFHLSPANLPLYVQELERFVPAVVDGYPSTCYVLARYLLAAGRTLPVRAVITSSETLYDFQREAIERAFACKVFDYYAAAERVLFTTECERHEGHHVSSEYGVLEVIDTRGAPVAAGQTGTLVATSLHNFGMPLLRYVTSDVSGLKPRPCSCGRTLPLMEDVSTKAEDILALADGRMISPSVLTHPFKPMHSVEQSQIVQQDYDHVVIRLVPNAAYRSSEGDYLVREFQARLGANVRVEVQVVDELERTKAGKFKWVISKVDKGIRVP